MYCPTGDKEVTDASRTTFEKTSDHYWAGSRDGRLRRELELGRQGAQPERFTWPGRLGGLGEFA